MSRERDESRVAEAARLYHEDGLTRDEVAEQFGVRGSTVTRWLDGTARSRGPRERDDVDSDVISDLAARGMSAQAIADEVGMSRSGVRARLRKLAGQPHWR